MDLNVEAAWAQGVTGKNVTTAIMDDGNIIIFRVLYLLPEKKLFILFLLLLEGIYQLYQLNKVYFYE